MKKNIIYFHIGTAKTGTTSIQSFLANNYDVCIIRDIYSQNIIVVVE